MKRVSRKFKSHAEADQADAEFYGKLTPEQRMEIMFELIAQYRAGFTAEELRFKKVVRITRRDNPEVVIFEGSCE